MHDFNYYFFFAQYLPSATVVGVVTLDVVPDVIEVSVDAVVPLTEVTVVSITVVSALSVVEIAVVPLVVVVSILMVVVCVSVVVVVVVVAVVVVVVVVVVVTVVEDVVVVVAPSSPVKHCVCTVSSLTIPPGPRTSQPPHPDLGHCTYLSCSDMSSDV